MAYKKEKILNYDQLSPLTRYRFAELELNRYHSILRAHYEFQFEGYQKALDQLLIVIAGRTSTAYRDELRTAFSSHRFRNPTRDEIVQYFRYKNLGIAKVAKYAQVSPNTVVTYNEQFPDFMPVFKQWESALGQETLERWDQIKSTLNLFDDKIIHQEPLIRKEYQPEELPPEVVQATSTYDPMKDFNNPDIDKSQWVWIPSAKRWMEKYDEYGNQHYYGI